MVSIVALSNSWDNVIFLPCYIFLLLLFFNCFKEGSSNEDLKGKRFERVRFEKINIT